MKFVISLLLVICCLHIGVSAQEGQANTDSDKKAQLDRLYEEYKQFNMRSYPEWASYLGDHRYAHQLTDNSLEAIKARNMELKGFLEKAKAIKPKGLEQQDKVSLGLFKATLKDDLKGFEQQIHLIPLSQQGGIHIQFPQIIGYQKLDNHRDFGRYIQRLRAFGKTVDDLIATMRVGISQKIVAPDFVIEQVIEQIDNVTAPSNEEITFSQPVLNDEKILGDQKEATKEKLFKVLDEVIRPSYQKLSTFLKNEYLPQCRKEAGIWALPNGKAKYEYQIEHHTTTSLTADEVFNIGQKEVARIRGEMEKLIKKIGHNGDLDSFIKFLRTDPQFYYTTKEPMMDEYRRILNIMDTKLPAMFGTLPKTPYDLKEIEEYRAASAPQAYYYSAPLDGSRPGYFYVNTTNLPARPKYTMTALALHEAVPGHHLQIALAQEIEGLPWFRQDYSSTAFVEGWALYAEYLGYESGMYKDEYQHFGALTFEMWRACRLVVDVGLHHKKWTREEAVQFMLENTPNSEADIRSEVDRYISWPGQALAYKIGELKIKELRALSEETLGSEFNLSDFHDKLLENGALPLPVLEKIIRHGLGLATSAEKEKEEKKEGSNSNLSPERKKLIESLPPGKAKGN